MTRRAASNIAIQLAGGLVGFLCWSLLGRVSVSVLSDASRALALGMILYLPVTLGVGPLLPNFFRGSSGVPRAGARRLTAIAMIVGVTFGALGVVTTLSGLVVLGAAMTFASFVASSTVIQQIARIQNSPATMLLGSIYNGALPGGTALVALLVPQLDPLGAVSVSMFAGCVLLAVLALRLVSRRGYESDAASTHSDLTTALLLVPHMLAFAVLTQGVRVPTLVGGGQSLVVQTNIVMLLVGLALAVIGAVGSQLSATLQRCEEKDAPRLARRNSRLLALLGVAGSVAIVAVYLIGAQVLFPYARPLDALTIALMSAIPPLYCSYYAATAILLRRRRTLKLSMLSVPIAAVFAVVSYVAIMNGATLGLLMALFVAASAGIAAGALTLVGRTLTAWKVSRAFAGYLSLSCSLSVAAVLGVALQSAL